MRASPAALALLLLAGIAAAGEIPGVPAAHGDRFRGEISPTGDRDVFRFRAPAGARLSAEVRAAPGSLLTPTLRLVNPEGDPGFLWGHLRGEGTGRLLLRPFLLPRTGTWGLSVGGDGGGTGPYEIVISLKAPKRTAFAPRTLPAEGTLEFPFGGGDGGVLSFALRLRGGPAPALSLRGPAGEAIPLPPGSVAVRGTRILGRGIPLGAGFGEYVLVATGAEAGEAVLDGVLVVKAPAGVPRTLDLGPEPRPSVFSPDRGSEGVAVTVSGSGFVEGAAIRFGGIPATDVEVAGPGTVRCRVPGGDSADLGLSVELEVVNPDGQSNAAPRKFRFFGSPKPTSVDPRYVPVEGGVPVAVSGSNFRTGFSLSIGGVAVGDAAISVDGKIRGTAPPLPAGAAAVTITDEFGRPGTLAAGLVYVGPPVLAAVSPASASFTGGRAITLTGTDLHAELEVLVDGAAAGPVTFLGAAGGLRFPMPAGPAGALDVEVRDAYGRSSLLPGALRRRGPFRRDDAAIPETAPGMEFRGNALSLGDLDGDGDPDLAVANAYAPYDGGSYAYGSALRILRNDGAGAFEDRTADDLGTFPASRDHGEGDAVRLGDLDGDGAAEVLLTLRYPLAAPYATFSRNGGTYAYAFTATYGTYADYPTYPATRLLRNDGTGTLADDTAASLPASTSTPYGGNGERNQGAAALLGDLDGDGKEDLLLVSAFPVVKGVVTGTTYLYGTTYLLQGYTVLPAARLLAGDGAGTFAAVAGAFPAPTFMAGSYSAYLAEAVEGAATALGDLDGDDDLDVVIVRSFPRAVYAYDPVTRTNVWTYPSSTRILRNDGSGSFAFVDGALPVPLGVTVPGSYEFWQGDAAALGDLDADGDLDLVLGRSSASYWYDGLAGVYRLVPAIRILANDGDGRFSEATGSFLDDGAWITGSAGTILSVRGIALGDLDGDGVLDMVLAGSVDYLYDYGGTGYGFAGVLPSGWRTATRVLLGDGNGRFADATGDWMPAAANGDHLPAGGALLGDLDGDGGPELVLGFAYEPYEYGVTTGTNSPLRILRSD
jgi:hypothetical protein